ncbi:MAG: hypothetical protein ACRDQZ_03470 [Mycobacteriales bacterium]
MSAGNVTPIRPPEGGGREPDQFDRLHDRMLGEITALRCVLATITTTDWEVDEDLSAAVSLFRRTLSTLDEVHNDLETWRIATRADSRGGPV